MQGTTYESARSATSKPDRAYQDRFEERADRGRKTPPIAEVLYLFLVGAMAYAAFVSMTFNGFGLSRMIEMTHR